MTWHERITGLILIAVFLSGVCVGWSEKTQRRRERRLVERMGRERTPW